jgi:hypothetical protein
MGELGGPNTITGRGAPPIVAEDPAELAPVAGPAFAALVPPPPPGPPGFAAEAACPVYPAGRPHP